jgi:signal transduction histidine kinase
VQALTAEAWRNERLINHFRTVLFSFVVCLGAIVQLAAMGRLFAPVLLAMLAWAAFLGIFNATWFKTHFHPAVPWVLSAIELMIIGGTFLGARETIVQLRPDMADRQISLLPSIFLFLVSINMVRFSWRLSIFHAFFALAVYLTVHFATLGPDPLAIPPVVIMIAMGAVLAFTTRRFESLLHRQANDLRRIQRDRIASLRSLVAGVCHELNNPIGALRSNAQVSARSIEILRSGQADPAKVERALAALAKVVEATEQATARVEKIVESLKGFARLDEAEVKSADVRTSVDEALALLASDLERVAVTKDYGEVPNITCRPGELNQVFMHVLRNSAQASAKKIAIKVMPNGNGVSVEISDDGKGISKETLDRIYDPTFSSKEGRVKMGFGLTSSRGIIDDHGGRMEIESTPGSGTTVRIFLEPELPAV